MKAETKVHALILAAGSGTRLGGEVPKQRLDLFGKSLLRRSVEAFSKAETVTDITVVTRDSDLEFAMECCRGLSVRAFLAGGKSRAESAKIGFESLPSDGFVAIHDAARCLITPKEIDSVVKEAMNHGAATAAIPVADTLKRVSDSQTILETVSRDHLYAAATPQVFSCELYRKALDSCKNDSEITDDNMIAEAIGASIRIVPTAKTNIKITYPEDLIIAKAILQSRGEGTMKTMRIGHGYDVHAFASGRDLWLGGVKIPSEKGLLGHSDADVLLHAVMDALLGAAGLGDIGRHFPDSDPAYAGISSLKLLAEVGKKLASVGAEIINIDVTLVMQAPKVAGFIPKMEENIARTLDLSLGSVNVKATTEEHLGFTGSGEGAACHAVALLQK